MLDISLNRTSKNTFPRKILDVLQQGISSLKKKNNVIRVPLPYGSHGRIWGWTEGTTASPFFVDILLLLLIILKNS